MDAPAPKRNLCLSAELYQAVFEQGTEAALIIDRRGRVLDANQRGAELTGYSRAEITAMTLADLTVPDAHEPTRFIASSRGTGEEEWTIRRKDGVGLQAAVFISRVRAGGEDLYVALLRTGSGRDRTERFLKLAKSMIDSASFGCYWVDGDGRIIYVNEEVCRCLGYTREELLRMSVEDIDAELTPGVLKELWNRLLKTRLHTFETTHRRKDGSRFAVEVTANYVKFDGGDYCCAYARDLTERKRKELEARIDEERLRQAIRVSNIGIFDHDHSADTFYWSPREREIHGLGPDETVTLQTFLDLVHPDDLDWVAAEVRRAHDPAGDGFWDVEHRIVRRDGAERWLTARSQTFFIGEGTERRPIRTVGAVRDITEMKQAEDERGKLQSQLIQAQKMESVGRLAGGVAHDFNNMLSVIMGQAELLMSQLEPGSRFYAGLDQIITAARRSGDLTRQLLAFARKQPIAPKVLDLNETIEGMLKMLRRLIGEHIEISWLPGRRLWAVRMDPAQVDQVLANLLVNARDASVEGGRVVIETSNIELDQSYCDERPECVAGRYVMLAVSDEGCGMDRETISHVFEPFFTTKKTGQGTGLGMATVYGIVKQNNGFIDVYSEPGRGTAFKIYLPLHADEADSVSLKAPEPVIKGGNETILLVEDDEMVLGLNKTVLQRLGYTVLPASAPSEAIRLAGEHTGKIHLLITDVVMPEMNGRDLANKLTGLFPDLKCLFLSGYAADIIIHQGELDKGVNFLQKPVSMSELSAKTREVLDNG